MRFILFALITLFSVGFTAAQSPVTWNYSVKKTGDKTFEVEIKAFVANPWHIYSQTTPDGGPLPTRITFNKNPLVSFDGNTNESGKLIKKYEEVFGIDVKYFDGNVVFTQLIKLKGKVKTNVTGSIEFMACNDEQCLPPATVNFTIPIQ